MPGIPRKLKTDQWLWLPTAVFLLGAASILLLHLEKQINEQQLNESKIIGATMDVQIRSTRAHLWLEHVIEGDLGVNPDNALADLDQAIHLMDAILTGGESEHGWIPEPVDDQTLRSRAQEIKSMLIEFKADSLKRLEDPLTFGIGSDFDKRYNGLFLELSAKARNLELMMDAREKKNREALGRLLPLSMFAWGLIVFSSSGSLFMLERKRKEFKEGLVAANAQLNVQAIELAQHRENLVGLVDQRTAELQVANERIQLEMTERLQTCEILHEAEKQNRYLSNKLLGAQEAERRRISMEIHDELGQSLNVVKLQLRDIERGSTGKREECEDLLAYMDQVIEEVRRISMDLSPTILEDLGLTSALHWLVDNLKKDPDLIVTADVEDLDHLLFRKNWITIYRVVQEALTNIVKHAKAENVRIIARKNGKNVSFSVEDDGKGFDRELALAQENHFKGLGLSTMSERVKILGGEFNLLSRKGNGTHVTFNIPIQITRQNHEPLSDHTC